MASLKVRLTGNTHLIMHNGRLADPDDENTVALKEITTKKKKTKADRLAMRRVEWEGGLYFDPVIGPYMPGPNLEAAIVEGGRISKKGADLERSIVVLELKVPLQYKGPRTIEKMYSSVDPCFVDVRCVSSQGKKGGGKVMRSRPIFAPGWVLEFTISFKERTIDRNDILTALQDSGDLTGLGDGRPKLGKFEVEVIEG